MTNTYLTLEELKGPSALNITSAGDDVRLLGMAEGVSRLIDRYCNRHFYATRATRRFDGSGAERLLLPDLVSVDDGGVRTDDGRDGTFGTTWDASDCVLLPANADPEGGGAASRPYTSIEVARRDTKQVWPAGREHGTDSGRVGMAAPGETRGRDGERGCGRGVEGGHGVERVRRVGGAHAGHRRGAALRPGVRGTGHWQRKGE